MTTLAPRETEVQAAVTALYRSLGAHVYSTSVYRPGGGKIAAGIPDLIVILPKHGVWFHEVKTPKGKQTDGQLLFQTRCAQAGVVYVVGGPEEARAALEMAGVLRGNAGNPQ